jgi:hypothetical protein
MIINNLANTTEKYYIVSATGRVEGPLPPASFTHVTPNGKPPYTVSLRCNGIKGIESTDVIVSWYSPSSTGIVATYPSGEAAGTQVSDTQEGAQE